MKKILLIFITFSVLTVFYFVSKENYPVNAESKSPTPTPTSKIDDVYFVIPTTIAQIYPDYRERLTKMIQEVNIIFAKNTEKRFTLKDVTLFDLNSFCDFTITTGPLQCERVFSYSGYQFPSAITVFVVPTNLGSINFDANLDGRVRWWYYLGNEEMFGYTTDRGVIGSIAHEFGHTLALGSPELYTYDQLIADGTNVEPVLPTQNYLPSEYRNDPMRSSHTIDDQFGPLNIAIVNGNLDRTRNDAYRDTAAYPKTITARIIDSSGAPIIDTEIRTFCIMGRGGSTFLDYYQRYKTYTDIFGRAPLRKVVSEELATPDAFPYECSIVVLKVSKIGYQPMARAVTALELQEAGILRKLEEYTISISLSTSTLNPAPILSPTPTPSRTPTPTPTPSPTCYWWENCGPTPTPVPTRTPTPTPTPINIRSGAIRFDGNPMVYVVQGTVIKWVPSPDVFNGLGLNWASVEVIPPSQKTNFQRAKLLRAENDEKVFYITESGLKRHIPNTNTFNSYGNLWQNVVIVKDFELSAIADNQLIRQGGDSKVYKLENGQKRWIKTAEAFNRLGLNWTQIAPVNSVEINSYPNGSPIE